MAEDLLGSLRRLCSEHSKAGYDHVQSTLDSNAKKKRLLEALLHIRNACRAGRINEREKQVLKDQLFTGRGYDRNLLQLLSPDERKALEDEFGLRGVGCDPTCTRDHTTDGICLRCQKPWGRPHHKEHFCLTDRGQWMVSYSSILLNRAKVEMNRGTGAYSSIHYCGRILNFGQCGHYGGPQCPDCEASTVFRGVEDKCKSISCTIDHTYHGNCTRCRNPWGRPYHNGHTCLNNVFGVCQGSWDFTRDVPTGGVRNRKKVEMRVATNGTFYCGCPSDHGRQCGPQNGQCPDCAFTATPARSTRCDASCTIKHTGKVCLICDQRWDASHHFDHWCLSRKSRGSWLLAPTKFNTDNVMTTLAADGRWYCGGPIVSFGFGNYCRSGDGQCDACRRVR